jgi:hypothetical protein
MTKAAVSAGMVARRPIASENIQIGGGDGATFAA